MALPATIRVNAAVPFPARVVGTGVVSVVKTNGVWTVELDFSQVSPATPQVADYPVTYIYMWNSATGVYNVVSMTDMQIATQAGLAAALEFIVDGGNQPIVAGLKGFLKVPFNCTIISAAMLLDQAGSAVLDLYRCTQATYNPPAVPTVAESITGATPLAIAAAKKVEDTTLTGWTTTLLAGDIIGFNFNSITGATKATVSVNLARTQ